MFDEPDEPKAEVTRDPAQRAKEKAEEFCLHAEVAAVFEGPRKFEDELRTGLHADTARDVQRRMARLAKAKSPETPLLPQPSAAEAVDLLRLHETLDLPTNAYHVYRRPGEAMIVQWIAGERVATFYQRLQAHFDAALEGFREDERQARGWKQDPDTTAYLEALDKVELKMDERYLRDTIRQHGLFVLSTVTVDEMNIAFLAEDVMGVAVAELVGEVSAPESTEVSTERERAWFFKLFALRGIADDVERMCFFAFLQKTDDSLDSW